MAGNRCVLREKLAIRVLVFLYCAAIVGCGSGEYQKRLNRTVEKLKQQSVFADLGEPQRLGETKISIRVPKDFHNADNKKDDPLYPKLKACSPMRPEHAAGPVFYYYLTEPKAEQGEDLPAMTLHWGWRDVAQARQDPSTELLYAVLEVLPTKDGTLRWEEVQFPTPEGGSVTWNKVSSSGNMEFVLVKCADGMLTGTKRTSGDLHLYLRKEGEVFVWMIWRVPGIIAGDVGQEGLAAKVGGALKSDAQ